MNTAYFKEKNLLYNYFQTFNFDNCKETWKQSIIKYLYHILSKEVSRDKGLGIGTYHTEDSPALTMIVEESILAQMVYSEIISGVYQSKTSAYRNALMNN